MTIKELLGVSERTLTTFVKSAYKLDINPLPALRRRFPNIDFRFTCNAYQKYASDLEDEDKPYILIIKDDENGIIEARLERYYFPWIHNPEYLEMPLPPKN